MISFAAYIILYILIILAVVFHGKNIVDKHKDDVIELRDKQNLAIRYIRLGVLLQLLLTATLFFVLFIGFGQVSEGVGMGTGMLLGLLGPLIVGQWMFMLIGLLYARRKVFIHVQTFVSIWFIVVGFFSISPTLAQIGLALPFMSEMIGNLSFVLSLFFLAPIFLGVGGIIGIIDRRKHKN